MDEDFVLVERVETSVVSTPVDQFVSVVVVEPTVITDEMLSFVTTEITDTQVVAAGQQGPAGPAGGEIDDVTVAADTTFSSLHIMELLYPFALSSFSLTPVTTEMGATVSTVSLAWATNYPPDTVSINQGIGAITPPTNTTYDHTGQAITTNRTYTITAVRNGVTKTANATVGFQNQYYWGVHTAQTTDEAIIKAMTKTLSGSRGRTVTFDCTGGRYFHIAYPSRLGAASFSINNLTYSDVTLTVVSITNSSGFTENYNVYYCNVIQNGAAITVVIS